MAMNEHLRRAVDALEQGAMEARALSYRSAEELRIRLSRTVEEVLEHLEADEEASQQPEDVIDRLDRQAKDIAEDLRRVDRLMRQRMGRE
jgi:predicted transcriptional regulator